MTQPSLRPASRTRGLRLLGPLGVALLAGCAPTADRGVERLYTATPLITHVDEAPEPPEWRLSPQPTATVGHRDRGHPALVDVSSATITGAGEIVVADRLGGSVHRFDPETGATWLVGGPGPGPGEFEEPTHVVTRDEGGFSVWDQALWRRSDFASDGSLVGTVPVPFDALGEAEAPPMYPARIVPLEGGRWLSLMEEKGKELPLEIGSRLSGAAYLFDRELRDFTWVADFPTRELAPIETPWGPFPHDRPLGANTLWAAGPGAQICGGDQAEAEVRCVLPSGVVAHRWTEEDRPARQSDPRFRRWTEELGRLYEGKLRPEEIEDVVASAALPAALPHFDALLFDDTGLLWVLATTADETWGARVIHPEHGGIARVASLPIRPLWIGEATVVGVREDRFGVQTVEVYALNRDPPP